MVAAKSTKSNEISNQDKTRKEKKRTRDAYVCLLDMKGENIPRSLTGLFRQIRLVCKLEGLDMSLERATVDTLTDTREEAVHGVVVMDLEEGPCEHFLGG